MSGLHIVNNSLGPWQPLSHLVEGPCLYLPGLLGDGFDSYSPYSRTCLLSVGILLLVSLEPSLASLSSPFEECFIWSVGLFCPPVPSSLGVAFVSLLGPWFENWIDHPVWLCSSSLYTQKLVQYLAYSRHSSNAYKMSDYMILFGRLCALLLVLKLWSLTIFIMNIYKQFNLSF